MTQTGSAKKIVKKSPVNWPVIITVTAAVVFIVSVWVNSYRVTHATAAITSTK